MSGVNAISSALGFLTSPGTHSDDRHLKKNTFSSFPFSLGSVPAALLCHLDSNKPAQSKLLLDSTLSCTSYCKLSLADFQSAFNQSSLDHAIICFPFTAIWFVFSEGSESLRKTHCNVFCFLLACTDMKCPFSCAERFHSLWPRHVLLASS